MWTYIYICTELKLYKSASTVQPQHCLQGKRFKLYPTIQVHFYSERFQVQPIIHVHFYFIFYFFIFLGGQGKRRRAGIQVLTSHSSALSKQSSKQVCVCVCVCVCTCVHACVCACVCDQKLPPATSHPTEKLRKTKQWP